MIGTWNTELSSYRPTTMSCMVAELHRENISWPLQATAATSAARATCFRKLAVKDTSQAPHFCSFVFVLVTMFSFVSAFSIGFVIVSISVPKCI